jgi:hypothetical protein
VRDGKNNQKTRLVPWAIRLLILAVPLLYFFAAEKRPSCQRDEFWPFAQGITRAMLEKTWAQGHRLRQNLRRYQVIGGVVYGEEGNLRHLLECMVERYSVPDVDFLYYAGDKLQSSFFKRGRFAHCAPIFVSAKHRSQDRAILFCDAFYDCKNQEEGWHAMIRAVETHLLPWQARESKLFWRGSPNDGRYKLDRWRQFPRGALVHLSSLHPDLIDARFAQLPVRSDTTPEEFERILGPAHYVPLEEQLRYKYHLIVDGVTTPFTGSYWKFLSGALVFKQESEDLMFFHQALIPWKHYIPIKHDLSDLLEKLAWAKEHDEEAQEIACHGRTFARTHLMPEQILFYCYQTLAKYASLQRFQPCPLLK